MKRLAVLLCVLCGSAVLAACGGSGSSSTSCDSTGPGNAGARAPTKAEYIARADALCGEEAPRLKARLRRGEDRVEESGEGTPGEYRAGAEALHEEAAAADAELGVFKRLEPPSGDGALIGSIVRHGERLAMRTDKIATALEEGRVRVGEEMLKGLEKESVFTNGLEQSYGFKVCGQVELGPAPDPTGTTTIG
jgi:hypothetical protein